jgi:hypothetical protein
VHWESALASAIEVAIAISGFSGIVAAVGHRSTGDWTPEDQLRLRVLLTASGVAGAFAFAPFILLDTQVEDSLIWRVGSGVQAAWFVAIPLYRRRQAAQSGAKLDWTLPILVGLYVPTVGGLVFNTVVLGAPWPYVAGVVMQLVVAFTAFVLLLLGSWRTGE